MSNQRASDFSEKEDIIDRAVSAIRATPGPDSPPQELVERIRRKAEHHDYVNLPHAAISRPLRHQVAWLPLAACILLMVTCCWLVGFHAQLFSQEAGRFISANGIVSTFYTDGRVTTSVGNEP